jgi:tetratricopeptide (TPR) repeat protein
MARSMFRRSEGIHALLAGLLLSALAPTGAEAAAFPTTAEDFARLPPYCAARLKKNENPAAYKQWEARLTMNCFIHIHHYCAALNDVEYAVRAKTKKERDQFLMDSMTGGFDYMWNQAGASCPMMPEIFTSKGKALIMLERKPEAAASFQKAIELNRRYIPAYVALADLYRRSGQTEAARQLLDYALKIEPQNKILTRRLAELDSGRKAGGSGR